MPSDRLDRARAALSRGDALIAYDEAMTVVASAPDDLEAQYYAALASARSGAPERAAQLAAALLGHIDRDTSTPVRLREDVAALGARVAKDKAFRARPEDRQSLAVAAASRYEEIAEKYGSYYACINAATLHLVAGDAERGRALASRARQLAADATPDGDESAYWIAATQAEAALLLGDVDAAGTALERAASISEDNVAARAATRHQLGVVCSTTGIDPGLLNMLRLPGVLHYCGHYIGSADPAQLPPALESALRTQVDVWLETHQIGIAFGALASGADILIAEALLDRGAEVNVVLPFDVDEFEQISVRPGGGEWVRRFRSCLDRASSLIQASDSSYLGDDELFEYAARIAMGHARNRAAILAVEAEQLAIWDGLPARGVGGTADDIAIWRAAGGRVSVVPFPEAAHPAAPGTGEARNSAGRSVQAMLFADFHGFSRLRDEHYSATLEHLYGPLAEVLAGYGDRVLWRNTWGDAVVAVFTDAVTAGRCALDIQAVSTSIDRVAIDLPTDLELRIAVHVGPVFARRDPFKASIGWWGREMTRAARIEPRTPEGEVYATDAFAALLALEVDSGLTSEYVGRVTTAKNFETIPMYRIRRS